MTIDNELKKDFINCIYFKTKKTLDDEDFSFYTIDNIAYELDQLIYSIKQIDLYRNFNTKLECKKPKKIESLFYIGNGENIDGIFYKILFFHYFGKFKKTKYETRTIKYLNEILTFLDKFRVVLG